MSIQFPVPPHGKARYPHPIWRSETCQSNFACAPPMAKHGNHTPYGSWKCVNSISHAPAPMAKQGSHTPYEGHKHVSSISRAPTPGPHGTTWYPHPIWRSRTCHFHFVCPPPMAKQRSHTPFGGQNISMQFRAPPPLPWQNTVPTPHMEVRNMSNHFTCPPPPWQNKVRHTPY